MKQSEPKITEQNFLTTCLVFRTRQAGVTTVYNPTENTYTYNAYCLEVDLLEELVTQEFRYLSDAIDFINQEFGSWEVQSFEKSSNCSSCVAK